MRLVLLSVLALTSGCDRLQTQHDESDDAYVRLALQSAEQTTEIERLKAEVEYLKQTDKMLAEQVDGVDGRVTSVLNWSKENEKIDDDRWEWLKAHRH